MLTLF